MKVRAGDLSMEYDQGFLRYIKLGDYEVLRMIYFALRDRNWDTMPGTLSNELVQVEDRSFSIYYTWTCTSIDFPFVWKVSIVGTDEEQISFQIDGSAQAEIMKNRTGFCVLHSIPENIGNPCSIISPNGEITEGKFPEFISPHQPFFNIQKMQWPLGSLGEAELKFEGDIFEMEDQRNWTDDSFKTYCTPLELPFPAKLSPGQSVKQKVTLTVKKQRAINHSETDVCVLAPRVAIQKNPAIGIGALNSNVPLHPEELDLISAIDFDYYHVEIDFSEKNWKKLWHLRLAEVLDLKLGLHLSLIFTESYLLEANEFCGELNRLPHEFSCAVLLLMKGKKTTPTELLKEVIPILKTVQIAIKIGGGTNAYFTELNRERVPTRDLDFVAYSVNPQVHAFDKASMIENIDAQGYTVQSAKVFFDELPVHVVPVTLKPRFNPNATSIDDAHPTASLPVDVDVRQLSLFGAAWTLGSIISLASSGVSLVAYYESIGWKGITQGRDLPADHFDFPTRKNLIFPMYHVFKTVLSHKDNLWQPLVSSKPLSIKGIRFETKSGSSLLFANYRDDKQVVQLLMDGTMYRAVFLDAITVESSGDSRNFFADRINQATWMDLAKPLILSIPANAIMYVEILS